MRRAELIRYLVLAAQREGNRRLSSDLRELGLTPSQAEVLRILGDHEPLTLSGLGALLVCESGTNPSRLVDRLVEAGLVARVNALDDRRRVELTLTAAGREREVAVRSVEERLYGAIDSALAGIELEPAIELLRRLSLGEPSGVALAERIRANDELASAGARTEATS
jgi:MarR family transcriptional regulator, organic hydroperoxide resistance regulator